MFITKNILLMFSLASTMMMLAYADQYPTYIWSKTIAGDKLEYQHEFEQDGVKVALSSSIVSDEIKNILESTDASSFVIYNRPGMTSGGLINTLKNNYMIGNLLRESKANAIERSYTDVSGESVTSVIASKFENVNTVVIDSKTSLADFIKQIQISDPLENKNYIIKIYFAQDSNFDNAVFQIERAIVLKTSGKHISALTGSPAEQRLLQDTNVEPTTADSETVEADDYYQYVTANILTKCLVFIPIIFLFIIATLQLYYIKAPSLYVEKSIDWGRIEK